MILVTFDSNVWRPVAAPMRFSNEPAVDVYQRINKAIRAGKINGRLSETIFTLEAISKVDRRSFFTRYCPRIDVGESTTADGGIRLSINISPDYAAHPGNNSYLTSHIADALSIGFQLMRCSRVAGVQNPDLDDKWFVTESVQNARTRANTFGEVARRIESKGAGRALIAQIGARYTSPNEFWFDGLANAPSAEDSAIAKAVAEWADGDSVAAHVAYGNHYFCTRDTAVSAGATSVFSASNKAWIGKDYRVKFRSPEELAKDIV